MEKNNTNWGIKSGIEIINSDDFMILLDNILCFDVNTNNISITNTMIKFIYMILYIR